MSEEEIQKALEIIKQPITVNCEDYHYFDQENYDKLVAVYDNCLWFIRNFEQINTTVERVQQENKILRENAEHNDKVVDKVNWENQQLKERVSYLERSCERKEETIINLRHEQQLDLYKEVIKEVRKMINFYETTEWGLRGYSILQKFRKTLDKVKGE